MIPLSWRLGALGALLAAVVGVWLYMGHLKREASQARSEAVAAQAQADINAEGTRQVEKVFRSETIIREKANGAVHEIQSAPGAETPVPPDVLDAWGRGIDGVRDGYASSSAEHPKPAS